jgi:hypothetical protein
MERAPEPTDICWENINVSFTQRIWKVCMTYLATLVLIAICFIFIFLLNLAKIELIKGITEEV